MKAKTIKGQSTADIKSGLEQCLASDFKPTLAFVFLSLKQDRHGISELLTKENIAIFGATTHGEFIDEELEQGTSVILLLDMNVNHFQIYFEEFGDNNCREVTQGIAKKAKESYSIPAFLTAGSSLETDGEELLRGFQDIIGDEVNVYGGMAGDDFAFAEQFVFTNGKESSKGMVVLVLDEDKIKIKGRATCGWKAVGTEKVVTKSEGNHVYTIDNVPALDLTAKYGGFEASPEKEILLFELGLQLQREKGDSVMRPGLVIDWTDHSFYCSGNVPEGSKIRFSVPPDFDVMEKVILAAEELKATEMAEADALVVFSCGGRNLAFGPMMNEEIKGLRNVWKVPMAGMFSSAELGRATGGNLEMHSLTTCCVALKEK